MIRLLLVLLFSFALSINSYGQDCDPIPQLIDSADFVLSKECSPYSFEKSIVVSSGRKLTIEDGVTLNFTGSERYIDVRGELKIGKGVTFNMGYGTYIKTEGDGAIEAIGSETDSITFTGDGWRYINANNSTFKYVKVISDNHGWWDWLIRLGNSSMENSRITGSKFGVSLNDQSTLKNSKVHNIYRNGLEIQNSNVSGNEIYDINIENTQEQHITIYNSTFSSNRVYQSSPTSNNWGIFVGGGSTIELNTIGGSSGSHGSVGLAVHEDNITIKNNNIGGYTSNVVIHGQRNNLVFENNNFFGELNTSSGQRNVTIENGNSDIIGYNRGGREFPGSILSVKINLENNYWGNTSDIPSSISDYNDDIDRKGIVDYDPKLSSAPASAPIQIPGGVTKALSGSDVILTWDKVTASDLAGYKIYSKDDDTYTLVQDVTDESLTSHTITGGDIETSYVITSYDSDADGDNDQVEGTESWYSSEFSKLSFSLSASSDAAITTVGNVSTYDEMWGIAGYDGDSAMYNRSYDRANDWINSNGFPVLHLQNDCSQDCQSNYYAGEVYGSTWNQRAIIEVNALVTSLSTSRSSGQYNYLGQYNGHSYFKTSWSDTWINHRDQANADGAYLAVINSKDEFDILDNGWGDSRPQGFYGYYADEEGTGFLLPGKWKWVNEVDPITGFDLILEESSSIATITATLDKIYSEDITISLSTGGSAKVTDDYTLSSETITVSSGSKSGTIILNVKEDDIDETDRDTIRLEVASSTYAIESVDQKLLIALEDNDDMPVVSLTASEDTVSENGGTSNITATLSTESGRDVKVNLRVSGTASSSDFTLGGKEIDISEVLTDGLVLNYTFSGDASDGTSNNNDGTVNGATLTEDRFGEENSAYLFDGEDDYISIPNSESLQIEEDITLTAWVKRDASNYWTDYVIYFQDGYYELRLDQRNNNTAFEAYSRGAGSWDHVSSSGNSESNDRWTMITFTSTKSTDENSKSKTFKMYVNGELRNTENRIGNRYSINTNNPLAIGSNSNGDHSHFKGTLDDIRIYNKALTDEEVTALYTSQSIQDVNASITISEGSKTGSIELKGVDDITDESNETVSTKIISAVGASLSSSKSASVILTDDDVTGVSLSVADGTIKEGTNQYATVTATLDKVSELPVTVYLDGSGVDAADYTFSISNDTTGTIASLAAHYKFNGNANDETENNHDGTVSGATLVDDRFGNATSAMYFDGSDDYISVPYVDELRIENEITISTWIKPMYSENTSDMRYITATSNEWFSMGINPRDNNSKFAWWGRSGPYWDNVGIECPDNNCGNRPNMDQWYMITYTYTKENSIDGVTGDTSEVFRARGYLDGKLIDTRIFSNNNGRTFSNSSGDMVIGALQQNQNHFKGVLDDLRIYNGALSAEDIKKLYDAEKEGEKDNNSIVIPAGETSGLVYVFAVDDDLYEASQNLSISISSVENGDGSNSSPVAVSIVDNESIPSVTISSDKDFIGESEEFKTATITAISDVGAGDTVMVILEKSGTATSGDDYQLSSDTILILPGNSSGSITVTAKWLSENEPTEGDENIILSVSSVVGAEEDGDQSITLKITEASCDNVDKELSGSIRDDLTLFELCSPYSVPDGKSLLRIREGATLTIEKGAVLNLLGSDQKIVVEGKLVVKGGATINMSEESYIEVTEDGVLEIAGTAEDYAIITGENWTKNTSTSNGPGILLESSNPSTIKYAKITNTNVSNGQWMIRSNDGSTIENSIITGGDYGITLNSNSSIINSEIYDIKREALSLDYSTATGNVIYNVNNYNNSSNETDVIVGNNSNFSKNRLYSSEERNDNVGVTVDGDNVTIEYNTIGGSSGIHGAVGISIPYNRTSTIRFNNIGGFLANLALHGIDNNQNYTFENNNFIGTLTGNQRHVVVYNQGDRTDWHVQNIPHYNRWGNSFDEDEINLSNNYWGTTSTSEIDDAIQDSEDDDTYDVDGYITYTPINSSPSLSAPIQSPSNLTKVTSGSDVKLTWDAVTASDLAGYKVYSKSEETYTLIKDITDTDAVSYTVSGGDIESAYVITAYDTSADGTNDQADGNESWYSSEFTKLTFTLSASSSDAISTIGDASTFDTFIVDGDSSDYNYDYNNVTVNMEWPNGYTEARGTLSSMWDETTNQELRGMRASRNYWHANLIVEVNDLVTSLNTTRSSGSYTYIGQYDGHSYFMSNWSSSWDEARDQANNDGGYLAVVNDDEEMSYLAGLSNNYQGWLGYYLEKSGTGYFYPGIWKWVNEIEPNSVFDIRLEEGTSNATITATLDRTYTEDVTVTLSSGGSAKVTDDYTLSSETITISSGSTSGSLTLTVKDDDLDEADKDTVTLEVLSTTYAVESSDQKILISIEDNDDMPVVSLTASEDTVAENGGISNITATLSATSGRDVTVNLGVEGTATSTDYTIDGKAVFSGDVLTDGLVLNYTFDDSNIIDAIVGDLSGNNDGELRGGKMVDDRFGESEKALYFDGEDDFISIPNSETLQIEDDITLNAWIKKDASNYWTDYVIYTQGEYYSLRLDQTNNNTQFHPYARGAGSHDFVNGNNYDNDEWVMITFTSSKSIDQDSNSKTFKIYANGKLFRTSTRIGKRFGLDKDSPVLIGSGSNGNNNNFKGALDDVRIYNKALTEEQVATLYAAQSAQDVSASITISEGSTTGLVELKGKDDVTDEPTELVTTKIVSAVGATISDNKSASVVLTDDDVTSVDISVSSNSIKEGTSQYATVTATLDKVSELPVTVYLGGSGVDATDYLFSATNDTSKVKATLAAHYKFNGDANDDTENNHDGTISGATLVEDRFGNSSSAMYFDGVDDIITVPYVDELRIQKDITVNTWIKVMKRDDQSSMRYLTGPTGGPWLQMAIHPRDDNNKFAWSGRSAGYWDNVEIECPNNNCGNRPSFDQWYMVTYTYGKETVIDDVTGDTSEVYKAKAYLDGTLLDTRSFSNNSNRNFNDANGNLYIGNGDGSDFFKGILDDLRIYDGALTSDEISTLYTKELLGENISKSNVIEISPGLLSSAVYIYAQDDDTFNEPNETITISIDSISNGINGSITSGDITIVDNDVKPSVNLSRVGSVSSIEEGKNRYATLQATLDKVTTRDVTVVLENSGDASELDYIISLDNDTSSTIATLAAHYNFNGNVNDISDNGNDGKAFGATLVPDRFGNDSSALYFDGNNDRVEVPFTGNLRIERDITINTWINVDSDGSQWEKDIVLSPNGYYELYVNTWSEGDQFRASGRAGSFGNDPVSIDCINNDCGNRPKRDRWYMITYTLGKEVETNSVSGETEELYVVRMYLDGNLVDTGYPSNEFQNNLMDGGTLLIGGGQDYFKGILDDLRIYDGALSADEISKIYQSESSNNELIENSIIVPAGKLSSKVYLFASDDEVFDESNEKTIFRIDTVYYGSINENSSAVEIEILENDVRPDISLEILENDTLTESMDSVYSTIKISLSEKTTRDVNLTLSSSNSRGEGIASNSDYIISKSKIDDEKASANLILDLKFNDNANDDSGNGNNGLEEGGVVYVEDRSGNPNSAVAFDGMNDYITIPWSSSLKTSEITMSAWIYVEDSPKDSPTLLGAPNEYYQIWIDDNYNDGIYEEIGEFNISATAGGYGARSGIDTNPVTDGHRASHQKWYMFTWTFGPEYDSINNDVYYWQKSYLNGVLVNEYFPNNDWNLSMPGSGNLRIGSDTNGANNFKGRLDDLRIYDGVISQEEILSLYTSGKIGAGSVFGEESINIPKDSLSSILYVYSVDDEIYEGIETLTIQVDTTDFGRKTSSSVSLVIEDNDDAPEVSLKLENEYVSEQDRFNKVDLVATLSNPTSKTVEVPLVFDGETDTLDFEISSNSIVIDPDQEEGSIIITALNDSISEGDEILEIRAVGVKNASDSIKQNLELIITEDICSFENTDLRGNILEDLTLYKLCGPYTVIGDVLIGNGATLTIEPGVTIEFAGPNSIKVDGGYIKAIGTEQDSITFTGVSWRGIDVITGGSEFAYNRIIDEGNSGQGDYILKLQGSEISHSRISGSYAGVYTYGNSSISKSLIHDIRKDALRLDNQSSAYGNIMYNVFTEADDNDQYAAVNVNNNSSFVNNLIYSKVEDRNMIAVSASWGNNVIEGNTIGLDNGLHGKFGILQREGDVNKILNNRIGGFKTNVVLIGSQQEFRGNTFMGHVDLSAKEMNVRIATDNIQEESQNYPGYIGSGFIWGNSYNNPNTEIDMEGNYWSNVNSSDIPKSIFDYNDRVDLRGNVNFGNALTSPSVDAPIAPPINLMKSTTPGGVKLQWSANEEKDLAGYKLYVNSKKSSDALDLGNVNEYIVSGGDIDDTYYITAYDTDADGTDDQYEGHESWFISPFGVITVSIESDKNAISELEEFSENTITVTLSSPSPEDITVSLFTSGEANVNKDYTIESSSLTITSGEVSATTTIKAIADEDDNEEDEVIEVSISEVSSGKIGNSSKASMVISTDICEFIPNTLFGDIEEDMTLYSLCSPYFVTGNLLVREGVTLTIQPGVELVFSEERLLRVNGTLIAEGTEEDSITFTGHNWKYIEITNNLGGSRISYANITDESDNEWGEWKVKLNRASSLSNSSIYNVSMGVAVGDSSSVNFNTFYDISQTAFDLYSGFAYGNTVYEVGSNYGNDAAVRLYGSSDFRNNRVYDIRGGAAAVLTHNNSIIEKNIIGDYTGRHGLAGIIVSNGNDHTIRNNKIGGFIANVVLIGTEPSFIRNSFIGNLNYQSGQRNVIVGNDNIRLYDSLNYNPSIEREFWGQNYNAEKVSINMRQNYWENIPSLFVDETIEDYNDNFDVVGEIVYSDELLVPDNNTPLTPPRGLEITESTLDKYTLSWNQNAEEDIAGYNIYTGLDLKNKLDAGNVTSTEITIDNVLEFNIALTAYDDKADGVNDIVEGNESLPATDYFLNTLPRAFNDTLRVPINEQIDIASYPASESVNIGFEFKNNISELTGTYEAKTASKDVMSNEVTLDFTIDRFGNQNSAVKFDGRDYISIDHDENLNLNTDNGFSISYWVKLDSSVFNEEWVKIISKGQDFDNSDRWWHFDHHPGYGLRFVYNWNYIHFNRRIYDNEWHHVSIVYQRNPLFGQEKMRLFFDGVQVGSNNNDLPEVNDNDGPLTLGASNINYERGLEGSLDEVIIYNIPIANEQVIELYEIKKGANVLSNDIDIDGDVLTSNLVESVSNGALVLESDGDVSYVPNEGFSGYDSFTYNVTDGSSNSENATVTISVSTPPTAVSDNYSVSEDSLLTVSVEEGILSNDTDPENDKLQVVIIGDEEYHADLTFTNWNPQSEPDNSDEGDFAVVGDQGFWYDVGYNQTNRFIVEFNDLRNNIDDSNYDYLGQWNGHSYFINNNWVDWNNAKLLSEQTNGGYLVVINSYAENQFLWNITYNQSYWLGYYQDRDDENYEEPQGGWKWVEDGIIKTHTEVYGDIDINSDGSFTYMPSRNFFGDNTFKYFAFDGLQYSDTASVTINVTPVDDRPDARNDYYTIYEDSILRAVSGFTSDVPEEGVVIHYPFDGNRDDFGPSNIELKVYGDPEPTEDRFGNLNGAYYFDGERDFMLGDASTFPKGNSSFSVSLWFKSDDIGQNRGYARQLFGFGGPAFNILFDNPALPSSNSLELQGMEYYLSGSYRFRSKYLYDRNKINSTWHNMVVTYIEDEDSSDDEAAGTLKLFFDGEEVMSNDLDMDTETFDKIFTIGAHPNSVGDFVYIYPQFKWFKGSIDDVVVYDRALTISEIDKLSSTSFASVLANDREVDGQDMTADQILDVTNGDITFNDNGTFIYTPDPEFFGYDSLTYIASDGALLSDTTYVLITIIEVDDVPVALPDSFEIDEDSLLSVGVDEGVLSNDIDVDGDELVSELVMTSPNGELTLNYDGSFTYLPNENFNGVDTFKYVTKDELNITDSVLVTITVNPVNDYPVTSDDSYVLETGNVLSVSVDSMGVLGNDIDIDGDTLYSLLIDSTTDGTISLDSMGLLTYTPDSDTYVGVDTFTYVGTDLTLTDTAIAVIKVTDRPVAVSDTFSVREDNCLRAGNFMDPPVIFTPYSYTTLTVLSNDSDQDAENLTAVLVESTTNGELKLYEDGKFEYCPNPDFNGIDIFTYVITDSYLYSDTVTVIINVNPVNDSPEGTEDLYGVLKNETLTVDSLEGVLANDIDVDGDTLTATLISDVESGTLTFNSNGSFSYTPSEDYLGAVNFTYNISDESFVTSAINVIVVVTARPVAIDDEYTLLEDSILSVGASEGILSNDTDEDNEVLYAELVSGTTDGQLTFLEDGSFEYVPSEDFNGNDSFTYIVSDGILTSNDTATVTITIDPVNDAPFGSSDSYTVDEGGTLTVDASEGLLINDIDIDSDSIFAEPGTDPLYGTVTINRDGSFEYVNNGSNAPTDVFTYKASDTLGAYESVEVIISINPINDAPVILPGQTLSIDENPDMSEIIGQVSVDDENIQADLSGQYTIVTDMLWCSDNNENIFEGNIVFERISTNEFGVNILTNSGKTLSGDYSFGGYFTCYDGYEGTPGGSLRLVVDESGLSISGSSQWGETFNFDTVIYDAQNLEIHWSNSSGESARSVITRDDNIEWANIVVGGSNNTGFEWNIISGNDNDAFVIDEVGNLYVNNPDEFDYEQTQSLSLSLTANDGEFTSIEENVTVAINNVWDMKISSTTIEDAYCGGGETGSISLEISGSEGAVSVVWRRGNETVSEGDESNLTIDNLSTGTYTVTIADDVGSITQDFQIVSPPIYSGVDVCYVSADSIDITKNRIFVNEGQNPYNIAKFLIFREGVVANQYDIIGEIDVTSGEGSFLDDVDNRVQAYRYKVAIEDNCGNVSELNDVEHVTNHLTANQGIGGEINLIWSGYEGMFVPTYQIYKSTNEGDFELLTEVSSNNTSYTDLDVNPANAYKYFIGFEADVNCVADPGGIAIEHHDFDDIDNVYIPNSILEEGATFINPTFGSSYITNTTGLKGKKVIRSSPFFLEPEPQEPLAVEPIIIESVDRVYPNPASQILYIDLADNAGEIENLYFVDFAGKVINNVRFKQSGDKAAVDTEYLQTGIYLLDVTTKLGHSRVKVIIQK